MDGSAQRTRAGTGMLVPIGGSEAKGKDEPIVLGRFVYVAGGLAAEIAVIPTASRVADTGSRYRDLFLRLGARSVHVVRPSTRRAADSAEGVALIERASAVFFTGGDQFRLSQRLIGTALAAAVQSRFAHGGVVGGTSAGASFLSERMIAFGKSGTAPRMDMVTLAPGLGLTSRFIIDQHFGHRNRMGRLLTALAIAPDAIGLGLDEDTAAFIGPDSLEVAGSGTLVVVHADPGEAQTPPPAARASDRHDPICMTDLTLHILVHGATFDVHNRVATSSSANRRGAREH